jgi:hypothetical protein
VDRVRYVEAVAELNDGLVLRGTSAPYDPSQQEQQEKAGSKTRDTNRFVHMLERTTKHSGRKSLLLFCSIVQYCTVP